MSDVNLSRLSQHRKKERMEMEKNAEKTRNSVEKKINKEKNYINFVALQVSVVRKVLSDINTFI